MALGVAASATQHPASTRAIESMVKPTRQKTKAMTRVKSMERKNLERERLNRHQKKCYKSSCGKMIRDQEIFSGSERLHDSCKYVAVFAVSQTSETDKSLAELRTLHM